MDHSSAKAASDVAISPSSPEKEKKKKKGRGAQKGQEISVINRQHPVNLTHMSLCDTYLVSVKLKPESITKKKKWNNLSDASCYNIKIDNILGQLSVRSYDCSLQEPK